MPVTGRGAQRGIVHQGRSGQSLAIDMLPKTNMESVVSDADKVCDIIIEVARTGEIGAGKIFITSVDEVIRVRTEERGRRRSNAGLPRSDLWINQLFQLHQRVVGAYGVHGLYVDGLNHAVSPGSYALLHLHRFHHAHFVPGGHPVSRPNHDGDNFSGHGTA